MKWLYRRFIQRALGYGVDQLIEELAEVHALLVQNGKERLANVIERLVNILFKLT